MPSTIEVWIRKGYWRFFMAQMSIDEAFALLEIPLGGLLGLLSKPKE